jgi:hypothetical protein
MGLKNAWQRLKTIWNFAVGALIGGAGVAAYYFWFSRTCGEICYVLDLVM